MIKSKVMGMHKIRSVGPLNKTIINMRSARHHRSGTRTRTPATSHSDLPPLSEEGAAQSTIPGGHHALKRNFQFLRQYCLRRFEQIDIAH